MSATSFDSLKGSIYIEAFKEANVREAVEGISFLREGTIKLVPITEMTSLYEFDKLEKYDLKRGQWVRIKSGLYENDLARILEIEDPVTQIYVMLIPRINETLGSEKKENIGEVNKKIKSSMKPLPSFFDPLKFKESQKKRHPKIQSEDFYIWNKMYFKDGFLIKSVRAKSLIIQDVLPNIEEVRAFESVNNRKSNFENELSNQQDNLLSMLNDFSAYKKRMFVKGDKVRIVQGNLPNVKATVISYNDKKVKMQLDIKDQELIVEMSESYVKKYFLPGDIVKVINGSHIGKFGIIVKVKDDLATIFSESTMSEFEVACNDLMLSCNSTNETDLNSIYQLEELVKINGTNSICYILDIQKHSLKVIDFANEVKNLLIKDVSKFIVKY